MVLVPVLYTILKKYVPHACRTQSLWTEVAAGGMSRAAGYPCEVLEQACGELKAQRAEQHRAYSIHQKAALAGVSCKMSASTKQIAFQ